MKFSWEFTIPLFTSTFFDIEEGISTQFFGGDIFIPKSLSIISIPSLELSIVKKLLPSPPPLSPEHLNNSKIGNTNNITL